jgi:DNA-nicking Smr family endonuclease
MAARHPSRDERALWRRATGDVKPLAEKRARVEPEAPEGLPPPRAHRAAAPVARPAAPLPSLEPGASPGLDRRTAEKLRRGRLEIEARLDLHGMTQEEAHRALARFIHRAQESGARTVLVITGKGSAAGGGGVLRAAVPRWLNEPGLRPRILSFTWAQPKDGGSGALYLLLRRQR